MKIITLMMGMLAFANVAHANPAVWGGTLYSKKEAIRLVCLSGGQNECSEFSVERAYVSRERGIEEFKSVLKITQPAENVWTDNSSRASHHGINNGYAWLAGAGTFVGLTSCMFAWYSCPYDLVAGITFDLYKAPVVAVAYVGHKLMGGPRKLKLANNIRFLLNPANSGKIKKTSKAQVKFIFKGIGYR